MKNIRLNLDLFGDGEEGAAEPTFRENTMEERQNEGASMDDQLSEDNVYSEIAELLGREVENANDVARVLKARRTRAALTEGLRKRKAERTYMQLISEAENLSSKVKGFDLKRELSDKRFRALINSGFSLEEAWQAVHLKELLRAAHENSKTAALASFMENIRSAGLRPDENGAGGSAPAKSDQSVENLTGKSIRDILRRVENGAKIKF